jgi:NadR type nicotinamide-nucleotide adenylyltransferase
MKRGAVRIVVTGSECTGKTSLACELARHYGAPCSAEFARFYLERKGEALTAQDVDAIAAGQIAEEDRAIDQAAALVVHDTDLLSTMVYARHYYGGCPRWIVEAMWRRRANLYLLLHPDVPWVADGLQRDRAAERDNMHALFRSALLEIAACFVDVTGSWELRRASALAAIDARIAAPADHGCPR